MSNVEFIAFAGGGISTISYVGALKVMEERNIRDNIKYWIGTSAGSIIALFANLNIPSSRIMEEINDFNPEDYLPSKRQILMNLPYLFQNLGVTNCSNLIKYLENKIEEAGYNKDITFEDLYNITGKYLIITVTELNSYTTLYVSVNTFPNMKIIDAIYCSITYPYLINPTMMEGNVIIDGGVLDNLSTNVCDIIKNGKIVGINKRVVGFTIINNKRWCPDRVEIDNLLSYSYSFVSAMHIKIQMNQSYQPYFWDRVVPIDTGDIKTLTVNVSKEQLMEIVKEGEKNANIYFDMRNMEGEDMFISLNGEKIDNDEIYNTQIYKICNNNNYVNEDILKIYGY